MGWIVGLSIGWVTPKTIQLVGIRCFSAEHAVLRSKSKDWFARNQDNVSEWSNMYIRGLLFPLANTIEKN